MKKDILKQFYKGFPSNPEARVRALKITLEKEFVFVDVKYETLVKNDNQIITNIKFNDLEKFYVEQINIFGNFITEEKVIRNSLIIDEGDAYNKFLFDKSI